MFKRALVSVSDKSGLVEFLTPLVGKGLQIVSTGGTAKHLAENGLPVIQVSEQTQFPEVMDGRVKTLHPYIHMGLLAREGNTTDHKILQEHSIEPFDLVVGNLYPFEKAFKKGEENLIEFIDIGGPSFLRAAAKSYERITVVTDPKDYQGILDKIEQDSWGEQERKMLAAKTFRHTSCYDSVISQALDPVTFPEEFAFSGQKVKTLRYGENPQQQGVWYSNKSHAFEGIEQAQILHGKELSYNNLLDIDAAVKTLSEFSDQVCTVSLKHNNPCGVALGETLEESVEKSLKADPVSVFGGIIACNQKVNLKSAELFSALFLECIVAPEFEPQALELLQKKKNIRLLQFKGIDSQSQFKVQSLMGGFLVQTEDQVEAWSNEWKVIGEGELTDEIRLDLGLAWRVCAHLKSNSIALARNGQTVGLGMGQVNRVDAVLQAVERRNQFHKEVKDPVLASDAFFPFPDSIDLAAKAGVKWIIQPGGSIKDKDVLARAKELGVTLVLTGRRHFLH